MLGKPKYKYGERVKFEIDGMTREGDIYIIDAYGTFEYLEDVSYDIMVDAGPRGGRCLFKHIPEKYVSQLP